MKKTSPTARPKRSIVTSIWLVVSQLMALGTLWIWAVAAGLSVVAAGGGRSAAVLVFILAAWA